MAATASVDTSREDITIMVEDYLNDKLQDPDDLENIDTLLLDIHEHQDLLKKQLQETGLALEKARHDAQEHQVLIRQKAELFEGQQDDIDRRLLYLSDSPNSNEAVKCLEEGIQKLRHLDIATGYLELLTEVDSLTAQARNEIGVSPEKSLECYRRLQKISSNLKALQPAAEDAAPHLVDHVEEACNSLWNYMKETLSVEFDQVLKRMEWPSRKLNLSPGIIRDWKTGAEKLLRLQGPKLEEQFRFFDQKSAVHGFTVLLPLEVMVRPLDLRFRYHFEGDRPTNRLDKPEFFMSHIIDLLNNYAPFMQRYLQPLLQDRYAKFEWDQLPTYSDSITAFITSLLPMVRRKTFSLLPQISAQPQLLSHFVHELIRFDLMLRDHWDYKPGGDMNSRKGLSWEVLVEKDWFGRWLQVERDFALSRYENIIDARDAGEIDYDSVEPGATKPTKAAIRVNDLLESITDRYRPLLSFSQKLRFLIDIQLAIFDKFHTRLQTALDAYVTATSAVVRAVQGTIRDDTASLEGARGLERLCRVHGSADYIAQALEDWSDDIFFLELWEELQIRARRNSGKKPLAGSLTAEEVAERTSSAVGSENDSGALFDETAEAYRRLRNRGEEMIIDTLNRTVREGLRSYSRINPWPLIDLNTSNSTESISPEVEGILQPLNLCLSFLARTLNRTTLRHVGRQHALFMQSYLWDYVLLRHSFSLNGALQFCQDLAAIWQVIDNYLGAGHGQRGMRKLSEGAILLSLDQNVEGKGDGFGLQEAEEEIFANNQRARAALEKLGLLVLTETEARSVLEHRVDVAT